ncbi:MAG: VOC family protein [Nitrososphaerota archaeon]|nr:VOC family protein [Nitrososphaerota archaeon]
MDKVQHFEIPADDLARVKKFYSSVFGWKIQDVLGMEYAMADSVETDENRQPIGGTNGGILKRNSDYASVTSITITVPDADNAVQKVISSGGTLVRKKEKFGNIGYVAYVKDTEGNVLGIWQSLRPVK